MKRTIAIGAVTAFLLSAGLPFSQAVTSVAPTAAAVSLTSRAAPTISINGMSYTKVKVKKGKKVKVTNNDSYDKHSVTANNGVFSVVVLPGQTKSFKAPKTPGNYKFHCLFHPMKGNLKVTK